MPWNTFAAINRKKKKNFKWFFILSSRFKRIYLGYKTEAIDYKKSKKMEKFLKFDKHDFFQ